MSRLQQCHSAAPAAPARKVPRARAYEVAPRRANAAHARRASRGGATAEATNANHNERRQNAREKVREGVGSGIVEEVRARQARLATRARQWGKVVEAYRQGNG